MREEPWGKDWKASKSANQQISVTRTGNRGKARVPVHAAENADYT
jgi:hypothetical protein